jgi:hypothetical protein
MGEDAVIGVGGALGACPHDVVAQHAGSPLRAFGEGDRDEVPRSRRDGPPVQCNGRLANRGPDVRSEMSQAPEQCGVVDF